MLILAGDIGWTFTRIACFGIAGPVRSGRVRTPYLPWNVDSTTLLGNPRTSVGAFA